ncbi:MAG: prolipoprotein diacylglyceryl transferase [Clostridiales bacterium]|nr:prolipoprotein diacylglyceryl transferase [Clostridiales bacterium]
MGHPDPIAFTIFGIAIRWYGILIAAGMLIAVLLSCKRAPRHGLTDEDVLDTALLMLPIGVIGARLYYVLFNLDYYKSFSSVIDIRSGGLAIHGGLIFGALTVLLVCKHKKIDTLNILDLFIPTVALAQAIGRWGNYFNGEAHGGPTDLPWGILVDGEMVHPTFLYESIWCLILFFALSYFDKNKRTAYGQTFALYLLFYSLERFFVEGLRTDSLMIGPFRQAQVISVCAAVFGILLYAYSSKKKLIDPAETSAEAEEPEDDPE